MALPRTTIYHWVRDIPIPRSWAAFPDEGRRKGNLMMQAKYRRLRDEAYELGHWEFPRLAEVPTFGDFVCLYVAEGYKRSRNTVSLGNSDRHVIRLANHWISHFARHPVRYAVQHHADQRLDDLARFCGQELNVSPTSINFQRKSNSGQLRHRTWRSKHGVLTVRAGDTIFRARLQGWIDRLHEAWLDSPHGA